MPEKRSIGQILMNTGRVDEEDVSRALEYQREHGGYFGEALVALGIVSQEELEWSLASQFDLPYVFPDAESIDPEAAALVSPEWALAHLALPIMKTEDTLTVVVDSPMKTRAIEDLQARTDKTIHLALASASKIRELVRQVYARSASPEPPERPVSVRLDQGFSLALDAASNRFGVSTRGHAAWFWYDDAGTLRRRPLEGSWPEEMDRLVSPAPSQLLRDQRQASMDAEVSREGMVSSVELRYLADESGREYLFRPVRKYSRLQERFPPPAQGILSEIRLLARSGSARFVVRAGPGDLGREILPHLPALLLDPSWRSVHVSVEEHRSAEEVFSVVAPRELGEWAQEAESLRAFHFDAVTVDPTGTEAGWALAGLEIAAVAFILWLGDEDRRPAYDAGVRWELGVEREEGKRLDWRLEPLQV